MQSPTCPNCENNAPDYTPHAVLCDNCGTFLARVPDELAPYWLYLLRDEADLYYVD